MSNKGSNTRRRLVFLLTVIALAGLALLAAWYMSGAFARTPEPWPVRWRIPDAVNLAGLPGADRFQWPIGSTHGGLAYNAQPFGVRDVSPMPHLGDDLNGCYGYNTDFGDPVRAVANGIVIAAGYGGRGWGKYIIVLHAVPGPGRQRSFVQSFYAHLSAIRVRRGQTVWRGQTIGAIGTADGAYYAHLHLEMRHFLNPFVGAGYRESLEGWINPVQFIAEHRGAKDDDVMQETALLILNRNNDAR
jgi:murein DD-endopeptidase MepM/ murein hydrolase activator NlpD